MDEISTPVSNPRENDIFISYSPRNILFVNKLKTAIRKQNRDPWIDLEDLPLGVDPNGPDAWQYTEAGIKDAEVFVFVISSDSVTSSKCRAELELAVKCKKRLLPIVRRQIADKDIPEALRNIPWISVNLNDPNAFEQLAEKVVHIHIHTRLLAKAIEWQHGGRGEELLLHERDLDSVKRWANQNIQKDLQLTKLQRQYIDASSDAYSKNLKLSQLDVFISYSRRDKKFVQDLCKALKHEKLNFWIDWENIPAAADWRQEIYEGIEASRTFLFIISRDSVASKYCRDEITHAVKNNKRLISIVLNRDYDNELVNPAIKKYSWIFLESFDTTLQQLKNAVNTDFKYEKSHTRWQLKAIDWDNNKRKEDLLLRDGELKDAQQWLLKSRAKLPGPTLLQKEYINASKAEEKRKRKKTLEQIFFLSFGVAVCILLVLNLMATGGEIRAMVSSLEGNQGLDALITSLRAAKMLNQWSWAVDRIDPNLKHRVVTALFKEIHEVKERNRLEKHQGRVYNVTYSHDGQLIASASQDKTVRLWRSDGNPVEPPLLGHTDGVTTIDFDHEDKILASASYDGSIKLWYLVDNACNETEKVKTIEGYTAEGHTGLVYIVRFSPNSQMLASASADGTVKLWTCKGELKKTLLHSPNKPVYSFSFSPDSRSLVSGGKDGVRLWSAKDNFSSSKLLTSGKPVSWVSFSPDNQTIASADFEGTVRLWRRDGTVIKSWRHQGRVHRVEFSADGQIIASTSDDMTVQLRRQNGTLFQTLRGHKAAIYRVQFSHDGRTIATGGADDTVKLWRTDDGTLLDSFEGHRGEVLSINFSPDDHTLASASADGTVRLWNVSAPDQSLPLMQLLRHNNRVYDVSFRAHDGFIASGSFKNIRLWRRDGLPFPPIEKAHKGDVLSVSFHPTDSDLIASAGADGDVKLWTRIATGIYNSQTLGKHQEAAANSISFSGDGKLLASGGDDGTLQLFWRLDNSSSKSLTFKGHDEDVSSVSLSPNGQLLASASKAFKGGYGKGKIKLWRIRGTSLNPQLRYEAEVVGDEGDVLSISFSPDGRLLASGGTDGIVKLWRLVHTPDEAINIVPVPPLEGGHTAPVSKVSFSPDGKLLASAGQDGTVSIWTKKGRLIVTFREHHREVSSIRFSPDSKTLASAGYDSKAFLWQSPQGFDNALLNQLMPYGCKLLRDYLKTYRNGYITDEARDDVKSFCQKIHDPKTFE